MAFNRVQLVTVLAVALVASCSAARHLTQQPDEQMVNNKFSQAQQDALTATINGDSSGLKGDQDDRGDFVQVRLACSEPLKLASTCRTGAPPSVACG